MDLNTCELKVALLARIDAGTAVVQLHNIQTDKSSHLSRLDLSEKDLHNKQKRKKSSPDDPHTGSFVDVFLNWCFVHTCGQRFISHFLCALSAFICLLPAFCSPYFWMDYSVCCYLLLCLRTWLAVVLPAGFEPCPGVTPCRCLLLWFGAKNLCSKQIFNLCACVKLQRESWKKQCWHLFYLVLFLLVKRNLMI